jgi:RNA polymerase sigma-70 factor (ECF subfamily)
VYLSEARHRYFPLAFTTEEAENRDNSRNSDFSNAMGEPGEVTLILEQVREGDEQAMQRLISLVYKELRRLAAYYMQQERPDHTLQPTALVHEAYLKLVGIKTPNWQNSSHFFAIAAQVMRNLLVDHARTRERAKRRGSATIQLDEDITLTFIQSVTLLAIDDALTRLSEIDSRQARIVELRYFAGMNNDQIALALDISERTVRREWQMAKAWLRAEIGEK